MTDTPQPPDPIDEILYEYTITHTGNSHNAQCRCIEGAKGHLKVALKKAMISRKAVEEALDKDFNTEHTMDNWKAGYNQAISDIRKALGMDK